MIYPSFTKKSSAMSRWMHGYPSVATHGLAALANIDCDESAKSFFEKIAGGDSASADEETFSVGFTVALIDLSPSQFTMKLQDQFIADTSKALTLPAGQVKIQGYAAGSVVVNARVVGCADEASATTICTKIAAAAKKLLSRSIFGAFDVRKPEVKVSGGTSASLSQWCSFIKGAELVSGSELGVALAAAKVTKKKGGSKPSSTRSTASSRLVLLI